MLNAYSQLVVSRSLPLVKGWIFISGFFQSWPSVATESGVGALGMSQLSTTGIRAVSYGGWAGRVVRFAGGATGVGPYSVA